MRHSFCRAVWQTFAALWWLLLFAGPVIAADTDAGMDKAEIAKRLVPFHPSTPEERKAAYAKYDATETADLTKLEFIRIGQEWIDRSTIEWEYGFLIEADEVEVVYFDLCLDVCRESLIPEPGQNPDYSIRFERIDLEEQIEKAFAIIPRLKVVDDHSQEYHDSGVEPLLWDYQNVMFILARAVEEKNPELAGKLYDRAVKFYRICFETESIQVPLLAFDDFLEDLAISQLENCYSAYSDLSISREDVLKKFENWQSRFQTSSLREHTAKTIHLLREAVEADRQHARDLASRGEKEPTPEQRIADLIDGLRHCNTMRWEDMRYADFDRSNSPIRLLVEHGYDAVPALIEALDDHRISRAVTGEMPPQHFTVGDHAVVALNRIAGRDFFQERFLGSYANARPTFSNSPDAPKIKQEIKDWYAIAKEMGEVQMLVEVLERGESPLPHPSVLLLEDRDPETALEVVSRFLPLTQYPEEREVLVDFAFSKCQEKAIPLLRDQIHHGKSLVVRLQSARFLHQLRQPDAIPAMIEEWKEFATTFAAMNDPKASREEVEALRKRLPEVRELADFLVGTGSVDARLAFADTMGRIPSDVRRELLHAFRPESNSRSNGRTLNPLAGCGDDAASPDVPEKSPQDLERDQQREAEIALFVSLLNDTASSGEVWVEPEFHLARICDEAAHRLHQIDPKRFPFDVRASFEKCEAARLAILESLSRDNNIPAVSADKQPITK